MKKKITVLCIALFGSIFIIDFYTNNVHSNTGGAPTGKTGSPGDASNCSSCHAINGTPATGAILITSNVPSGGYISGNTYAITVRAAHATFNKFGFQISPQSTSGALLGTLATTNNTETQLVGSSKYVTHKSAGTAGTNIPMVGNFKEWSFNWTAPAVGTGNVTFYGAAILANANNQNSGDSLVLGTLVVNESSTNSIITNAKNRDDIMLFPNPASNILNISINENASVAIIDINGKTVLEQNIQSGINTLNIQMLPSGIYFARIIGKDKKDILKFAKQ